MQTATDRSIVNVGVIGFGYWGPKIARNINEIEDAALSWIVDASPERLARARAHYPMAQTSRSFEEMVGSDVDAIVIATPIRTHFQLARTALLHGKHVMVEKPLTASSAGSGARVRLTSRSDRITITTPLRTAAIASRVSCSSADRNASALTVDDVESSPASYVSGSVSAGRSGCALNASS